MSIKRTEGPGRKYECKISGLFPHFPDKFTEIPRLFLAFARCCNKQKNGQ